MSTTTLAVHQARYEQKSFWRNPPAAAFTFAFPIMFLVIFASLNSGSRISYLGNIKFNQYYTPGIIAFGVISATYTNLAMTLSNRRDAGILKRLRATPLPATAMFGGLLINAVVVAAVLVAIVTAAGMLFYGVTFPGHYLALLVSLLVGAACFCSIGVAVSALVPNADAAPAIVNFLLFPIVIISGVFFPVQPGSTWSRIGDYLPVRHFVNAVFAAFDPRLPHGPTHGFAGRDLLVLGIWTLAAGFLAVRRFRWEPGPSVDRSGGRRTRGSRV